MKFFTLRRALLAALAGSTLILTGAASAVPLDVGPLDTTPPQVIAVKPLNGSATAAPNTNIGVEFSEPMDKPATENAVKVERVGGTRVAGTFMWLGSSLVFDPAADLVAGAKYVAVVGTGAMDESGNPLSQARTWEFKIAGFPTTTPIASTSTPRAVGIFTGMLRSGDVSGLSADDDAFFAVDGAKTWGGSSTTSRIVLADSYALLPARHGLRSLKVTYRGSASAKCVQVVSIYNWTTGVWEKLDSRTVDSNEVEIEGSPSGKLGNYVSPSQTAPDVAVRVQCTRYDGWGFTSRGDLLSISYEA